MTHVKSSTRVNIFGTLTAMTLTLGLLFTACSTEEGDQDALASMFEGLNSTQLYALAQGANTYSGLGGSVGIQSTGIGVIEALPDIAVISLGVETLAATVSDSRRDAAAAIEAMLAVLHDLGVANKDLETQYFNIRPEYTYDQVVTTLKNGQEVTRSERRLIGYRVTNTLSVTIRDLDRIGAIVDSVADAGGEATRLNNISFSIDDGSALETQARNLALLDAVAKADLYASVTGVTRGKLVSLVETGGTQHPKTMRAENFTAGALDSAAAQTQIIAGDLQVRVTVQTVFRIE